MTRKEVCTATGLSIKTLRLYEEKGLIAPERQYRNGREYRVYTPELVAQLQQIATLRRALFTMDEIKSMQQNPDTIPGIFEDYRQWLAAQETQFRALRQAAGQVNAQSLHSVDSLLSGMEQAASQMPLPEMDIKPDFKHIDAMEEPPRHVVQQKDLDDMVPNARVFRQMNLMMDGDRSNNINVAFGQVNELRHQAPEESGPVQEKHSIPRWQRISPRRTAMWWISARCRPCSQNTWAAWACMPASPSATARKRMILPFRSCVSCCKVPINVIFLGFFPQTH